MRTGASPSDFVLQVKAYYLGESADDSAPKDNIAEAPKQKIPNVDGPFLDHVWKCLVQNSDISAGENGQYRDLTLAEAEASHKPQPSSSTKGYTSQLATDTGGGGIQQQSGSSVDRNETPLIIAEVQGKNTPTTTEHDTSEQTSMPIYVPCDVPSASTVNTVSSQQAASKESDAKVDLITANNGVRLFASENRMWHALTGHEPDPSRLKELDFVLLSIIASYGTKGILQHDLVRVSGQDKRSLPHRTDRLHEHGYIEKKKISSLLWEEDYARKVHTSLCTLRRFVQDPQHHKEVKRLIGEVKAKKTKNRKGKKFANNKMPLIYGIDEEESNPEIVHEYSAQSSSQRAEEQNESMLKAQWLSDRCVSNQVFDIIEKTGTKGATIPQIRERLFGDDYKKPTESILGRLVDAWQISQPLYLRHLAIVRDTVLQGKSPIYIHYTYGNFRRLVDGGKATWKAVTTIATTKSEEGSKAALLDSQPDNDEHGFPTLDVRAFQGENRDATLSESSAKMPPASISSHTNRPYQSKRSRDRSSLRKDSQTFLVKETETPRERAITVKRGVGRPRKYPKPGLPVNLEEMTYEDLNELQRSRVLAGKYQKAKILKEIQRRVELGENQEEAAKEVLRETDEAIPIRNQERLYPNVREEILYTFGIGPSPRPSELDIALLNRQKKYASKSKRERQKKEQQQPQDIPYYPSIAAHTFFVPRDSTPFRSYEKLDSPADGATASDQGTRKRKINLLLQAEKNVRKKKQPKSRIISYYPSIAAHTFLVPNDSALCRSYQKLKPPTDSANLFDEGATKRKINLPSESLPTNKSGRKRGRPPKFRRVHYYPSTAAHTFFVPCDPTPHRSYYKPKKSTSNSSLTDMGTRKRKLNIPDILLPADPNPTKRQKVNNDSCQSIGESTSQETSQKANNVSHNSTTQFAALKNASSIERAAQGRHPMSEMMAKRYVEQLRKIVRPHDGFFAGESLGLRRRRGDSHFEQPILYKVVVFRLQRLKTLIWFTASQPLSQSDSSGSLQNCCGTLRVDVEIHDQPEYGNENVALSTHLPPEGPSTQKSPGIGSIEILEGLNSLAKDLRPATVAEVRPTSPTRALHPISPPLSTSSPPIDVAQSERVRSHHTPSDALATENRVNGDLITLTQDAVDTPSQDAPSSTLNLSNGRYQSDHLNSQIIVNTPSVHGPQNSREQRDVGSNEQYPRLTQEIETVISNGRLPSNVQPGEVQLKPSDGDHNSLHEEWTLTQERVIRLQKPDTSLWTTLKVPSSFLQRISEQAPLDMSVHEEVGQFANLEIPHDQTHHQHSSAPQPLCRQQKKPRLNNEKMSFMGINRRGGSTAILRGDIIMDLVRKCGGVSPGFGVLAVPFGVEWTRRGQPGQPERDTVRTAANNLCKAGRLRQLTFAYQTKEGLTKTSSLYTLPEIDPTDPTIKKLQDEIRDYHPRVYIPTEWLMTDEKPAEGSEQTVKSPRDGSTNQRVAESFSRLDYHKQLLKSSKRANEDRSARIQKVLERERIRADKAIYGRNNSGSPPGPKQLGRRPNGRTPADFRRQKVVGHGQKVGIAGMFGDFTLQNPATMKWQLMKPPALRAVWRKYYTVRKKPTKKRHRPMYSLSKPAKPVDDSEFRVVPQMARPHDSILQQRSKVPWVGGDVTDLDMSMTTDDEDESSASETSPNDFSRPSVLRYRPLLPKVPIIPQLTGQSSAKDEPASMPSYMDPRQFFSPLNGTFSTTFDGVPSSLIEVKRFQMDDRRRTINGKAIWRDKKPKPLKSAFAQEVEQVERDELELPNFQDLVLPDWTFISHVFSHPHKSVHTNTTEIDWGKIYVNDGTTGRVGTKAMAKVLDIEPTPSARVTGSGTGMIPRKCSRLLKDPPSNRILKLKRKRRRNTSTSGDPNRYGDKEQQCSNGPKPHKLRRIKGPQDFRSLTEEEEQRLVTAVVAIRCLTGGVEKRIDWSLVAIVFEPKRDEEFIHTRWNHTRHKYKASLRRAESDFQEAFLQAYEEGVVPAINFDDLKAYPWKWLVQWVMERIAAPLQSLPDLDLNSSRLLDKYILNNITEMDMNRFYEINCLGDTHSRKALVNRYPWICSLSNNLPEPSKEDSDLAIAKTWIRANVATLHENYIPDVARATLLTFTEETIEAALQDLLANKLLIQEQKRRLVPGRNYDLNEQTFARLQKNIPVSAFHRAASFKAHLDAELAFNGSIEYSPHAKDGDVIAVLNMLSSGRIMLRTKDVPMNKMGHTDGRYKTRQMDKSRLFCNVLIVPLPAYVPRNPLLPLPPPPAKHLLPTSSARTPAAVEKRKIPLWYDIHGHLIQPLWELALAAVMAVLVTRPGIGVKEVEQAVRPCMEEWEIEWVLEWIVKAGVATARGEGRGRRWITGEWWWLVLGGGEVARELEGWVKSV